MGRTRIKICGVRTEADVSAAVRAGADAVGFNFVPASPRFVEPADATELVRRLPAFVASVAVVAGRTTDEIRAVYAACATTLIQLHGDETPALASSLPVPVVRAFRFDPATIHDDLRRWGGAENVAALLIDGSGGGEGRAFRWSDLGRPRAPTIPIIVAGGLTPENVGEAVRTLHPYAVDVASGVESSRGVKDPERIKRFCNAVRSADREVYGD